MTFKDKYKQMRAGEQTVTQEKPPFYFQGLTKEQTDILVRRSAMQTNYRKRKKIRAKLWKQKNIL